MESTGKYWFPIHDILEESCYVVVSHTKFVKAIKGRKTTRKILSGFSIYLSTILSVEASSRLKIYGILETFAAIGVN